LAPGASSKFTFKFNVITCLDRGGEVREFKSLSAPRNEAA